MSVSSKAKPAIRSSSTLPRFYALPRDVVIRILAFLPFNSLLACQRISKRFRFLITRSTEIRPHLFLEPPNPSPAPDTNISTSLHPVFARLNFFAYHSAKAIRIGEGLNGIYLMKCAVREQFATSPALEEVVIRAISGGEWPFDAEIAISNKKGVTVWDTVCGVTGFFNEYKQISFGDHFGLEVCVEHKWDPKALMQNHEFLNPNSPFPTIYIPDRACNKVFIADYAFNEFAAMPLAQRPAEWYAEQKKEVEGNKSDTNLPGDGKTKIKEAEVQEAEVQEVEDEEGELEDGKQVEQKSEVLNKKEDNIDTDAQISTGGNTTEIDNSSGIQEESHSNSVHNPDTPDDISASIEEATVVPKTLTFEGKIKGKPEDHVPLPLEIDGSAPLDTIANGNIPPSQELGRFSSKADNPPSTRRSPEKLPRVKVFEAAEILFTAPNMPKRISAITPAINTSINLNPGAPYATSVNFPIQRSIEWEEAFD